MLGTKRKRGGTVLMQRWVTRPPPVKWKCRQKSTAGRKVEVEGAQCSAPPRSLTASRHGEPCSGKATG